MNTPHTNVLIDRTASSLRSNEAAVHLLRAVAVILLAVGGAVLIDAGYALPGYGLLLLDVVLLCVAVVTLRPLLKCLFRRAADRRQTALYIEKRLNIPCNQLINALDLSTQGDPNTSAALRNESIAQGESIAQSVADQPIVSRKALKEATKPAAAAVIALVLAYVFIPSAFHAVMPRLVAPFADLPPFTLVQFEVNVDPDPVYFGKLATIRADLSVSGELGPAHVVFVDENDKSAPLPMYRVYSPDRPADEPQAIQHFALRIERIESTRQFYITTPRGRSRLYTLTPDMSPLIEQASVGYDYPDYTNWPDTHGPLHSAGIRALEGTDVTLHIESNVPLGDSSLQLSTDGKDAPAAGPPKTVTLTPDPDNPRHATASFPLGTSGTYELALTGADGKPGVQTLQGEFAALPDRAPKIDVIHPERQTIVPEGWPVESEFVAGDDIGVDQTVLHVGLNDEPTSPVELQLAFADRQRTVAHAAYTFDPGASGARAGDMLRYYATARDNHPGSPQLTESPVHAIHIITMEQYLEIARSQYRVDDLNREFEMFLDRLGDLQAQRDELLEQLTELQEQLDTGEPLSDAQQQQMAELEKALSEYAESSAELAEALNQRAEQASLYEFEDAYKQMLQQLAQGLQAQSDGAQSLSSSIDELQQNDGLAQRESANRLADEFALMEEPFSSDTQEQTEYTEQELEKVRHAEAMIEQGERIRRIAMEQDELAVRMSGLADDLQWTDEQRARAEQLAQEQAELRDELDEAARVLRAAAEQAREALPNMSGGALVIVDKIQDLRIVMTQTAAEKASLAGNGPIAYQAAREAANKLDSLLSDVQQSQQASNELDGCFNLPREQVQNMMQQLASGRGAPRMGSQGSSGVGMAGSSSRFTMAGPSIPGQPGDNQTRQGRHGARGMPGRSVNSDEETTEPAELILADPSEHSTHAISRYPGVPSEYREQAEAYFKRIAEEQ